jgi:hypothetical protein
MFIGLLVYWFISLLVYWSISGGDLRMTTDKFNITIVMLSLSKRPRQGLGMTIPRQGLGMTKGLKTQNSKLKT